MPKQKYRAGAFAQDQQTLTEATTSIEDNEAAVTPAKNADFAWYKIEDSDLLTIYKADLQIEDIKTEIRVSTPQDGTWSVSAQIYIDDWGIAFLPSLLPADQASECYADRSWYNTKDAADQAARELIANIPTATMLEQFIIGQSMRNHIDDRSIEAVVNELT